MSFGFSYSFKRRTFKMSQWRSVSKPAIGPIFEKALLGVFAVFIGCAPAPVSRKFKPVKTEFGTLLEDTDIPVDHIRLEGLPTPASFQWEGVTNTSAWYHVAEDLMTLSKMTRQPELAKISVKMREALIDAGVSWRQPLRLSPYVSAAVGETRDDTRAAVQEATTMLKAQEPLILKLLKEQNDRMDWPHDGVSLVEITKKVDSFLDGFVSSLETSAVNVEVRKQLVEELQLNFGPRITRVRARLFTAYNEDKVYNFVARVREVLKFEGINLGKDLDAQLDLAERLPREAEKINSAKKALAVLIDFWLASSQETRDQQFRPVSKDLYDFFKGQSESDLDCLKKGCGIFTVLKRELFILPKLEEYGVDKLRTKLVDAAATAIIGELEAQATQFMPQLYVEVGDAIIEELRRQSHNFQAIADDYNNYLGIAMSRMALAKFGIHEKDLVNGLEPLKIDVRVDFSKKGIEVGQAPQVKGAPQFSSGAGVIGAGMSLAALQLDEAIEDYYRAKRLNPIVIDQTISRTFFEQINKVLVLGGFKTASQKPFEALAVAILNNGKQPRKRYDLRTMSGVREPFAVPDSIELTKSQDQVFLSKIPANLTVSVADQADLLRGLSRVAIILKDWEMTKFDQTLGKIVLADFVPDLPRESVDRQLFPKDLFYAAALGNAATILQNITKSSSSIALISPSRRIRWANESLGPEIELAGPITGKGEAPQVNPSGTSDISVVPAEQETMATVFNLVNGKKSKDTKIGDVARFVSSLVVFLKAIDGIENTTSELLRDKGSGQVSPLDQFIGGREDVKLLIMALANFLSREARGPDGLVRPIYRRDTDRKALGALGTPALLDQALVIRALLEAADVISASVYRLEAQDIFSAVNKYLFRPELAFYSNSSGIAEAPSLEAAANMLVAGEALKNYLNPERRGQWDRLIKPWLAALRDTARHLQ